MTLIGRICADFFLMWFDCSIKTGVLVKTGALAYYESNHVHPISHLKEDTLWLCLRLLL